MTMANKIIHLIHPTNNSDIEGEIDESLTVSQVCSELIAANLLNNGKEYYLLTYFYEGRNRQHRIFYGTDSFENIENDAVIRILIR